MRTAKMLSVSIFFPVFLTYAMAQSVFRQSDLKCPQGFRTELFVFNEPFSLTKEQNEIITGQTDQACFQLCKERQTCVAAIYQAQDHRCALANIDQTNIDMVCEEFNDKASFDRSRQFDQFDCSSGCQAMKKVCEKCGDSALSVAAANVYCRRKAASILDLCQQEEGPVIVEPITKKPLVEFQAQTDVDPNRVDQNVFCCFWARIGECDMNPFWMRPNCPFSCGTPGCRIEQALNCPVKLNVEACSRLLIPVIQPRLQPQPQPRPQPHAIAPPACVDLDPFCRYYAAVGHCLARSKYMEDNCKVTCKYC